MTSYLNNGYDVINYFAKFQKFLSHSIIMPSFMTVGSQMPELDRGGLNKIGSQNTKYPYKLGLNLDHLTRILWNFILCKSVQYPRGCDNSKTVE